MNGSSPTAPGPFIRLRQEGRTEEVVRRLMDAIDLGLFAEGQQLPSETELAMQFGVATVTLREALAYLRQRGVIETRRGRNGGSFIRAIEEIPAEIVLSRLDELSTIDLRDLCDEHIAISGTAARLAARRASREHHQHLAQYIETLGKASTRHERRRADARFHIEIAVASQSVRLTHAEIRLQAEIGELLWLPVPGAPGVETIQQEHTAIREAIVAGDPNLAGALVEAHVNRGIKRLIDMKLELLAQEAP
ncbi:FCD domain-containing protein [Pseudomonas sp. R3.Fl]|uniref:FadR/GntR family transcriptional regulator n=1 Tax=Pseudomonas TaxID=286 RepID=UPI00201DF5F4|nr:MULTISPECIES: FCD domain-containing protein [Pseudomonas]MCL6691007.1 FCD domain-containing protein [Pseudomonas sp. R3.Fl]UXJ53473.1 FCD domain-containing protein [Pseudomonas citronellolis]